MTATRRRSRLCRGGRRKPGRFTVKLYPASSLPDSRETSLSCHPGRVLSDEAGYSFTVKRPGFLHWTGNLALSAPNIRLENGEEIWFTDALIIWPPSGVM